MKLQQLKQTQMCCKTILTPLVRTQDSSQQQVTAPSVHVASVYTCVMSENQA